MAATRLSAQSYITNPKLLELEIAKAYAEGLKEACKGVQTCVIGGTNIRLLGKQVPLGQ